MEVILLSDVEKVGLRGDVVDVARGYARNFLLPRRLAETATPAKVAELGRRDAQRARHEAKTVDQARDLESRLVQTTLVFQARAGPTGVLFGSVTATNIVDRLWAEQKIRLDRRRVALAEPIKRVGRYQVPIELFTDVSAEIATYVLPEGMAVDEFEAEQAAAEADAQDAASVEGTTEPAVPAEAPTDEAPGLLTREDAASEAAPEVDERERR